jgi:Kef-type K+ transport system membrane component KefB
MAWFFGQLVALRDLMSTHILFTLGAMLLIGYLTGVLAGRIRLPEITGFILAGVIVGESVLGIVPLHMTSSMKVITEVALGLIALTIGSEFSLVKLRRMGREVASITAVQLGGTFAVVFAVMLTFGMELPFALIIAAIATASSPAVAVAVVQSLRAHGTFVDYLYGVVALLDAGAVILFGVVFSIAAGLMGLTAPGAGPATLLLIAVGEVVFSLITGVVMGLVLHFAVRRKTRANEILLITLGVAFTFTAGAIVFHLSPLLINMTAGAVMINATPRHHRVFRMLEPMTPPIYALFFVLAGSELQIALLTDPRILVLGGAYIIARGLSKYGTVYLGGALSGTAAPIRNNLGFCMLPQAGVSLGLVLFVQASPVSGAMNAAQIAMTGTLVNVILLSVFVNQVIGPPLAKAAIIRGNEMEVQ